MKLTLNLLALIIFSTSFISCSNDALVTTNPSEEYFDYSVQNVPIPEANSISAGDDRTFFATSLNGGWKITDGNAAKIDFQDIFFRPYNVRTFDANYAVFTGTIEGSTIFKIYNSGIVKSVNTPLTSNGEVFLFGKNLFITPGNNKYYFYKDSSFTEFALPPLYYLVNAGVYNNEYYLIVNDKQEPNKNHIYKHTSSGPIEIFSEFNTLTFNIQDNILTFRPAEANQYSVSSFTEGGWQPLYTSQLTSYEHPRKIIGSSLNFLIELGTDEINGNVVMLIKVRDGNSFFKQTNFPYNVFSVTDLNTPIISEYKNNSFYLYKSMGDGARIIKAKLKSQP